MPTRYTGRFAPSPTGPLHLGSLLAAIASYLDARSNNGRWQLRIEDLDPLREPAGAADQILRQLEQFNLSWDGAVLYQSTRLDAYAAVLEQLTRAQLCYACTCTRPQIRAMGLVYNGHCRQRQLEITDRADSSIRLKTEPGQLTFTDAVQGDNTTEIAADCGDFIIRRKDGLFAYQLAVVIDDQYQGITDIVRGFDLLDSTPRQIYLQRLLQYHTPRYCHLPVITDANGDKLSKQRFAAAIEASQALPLTHHVLQLLGQDPPTLTDFADNAALLAWAVAHWDIQAVPKLANIPQANLR